ncbi:MAG TPA: response regulator [Bacteroidia bacterium]|jgi:DNA-binding response OmpR family regulator|nr:response regulator [Bacteroidia bacterium]
MSLKILITDDDEDDHDILTAAFKTLRLGYHIEQLKSGEELIKYLFKTELKELPALIILDYNMPKLNGLETLKQIRSKSVFSKTPILIHSTSDDYHLQQALLSNGATAYVQKRSSLKEIEEFVLAIDDYLKGDNKKLGLLSETNISACL